MRIKRVNGPCPRGEINFEAWFLFASATLAIGCLFWLQLGLPWPHCWVRQTFGLPCPTCGATRCALALAHGDVRSALLFNPMMLAAYSATGLFDLYAIGVLWFGLPRLRLAEVPAKIEQVLSLLLIIVATGNWIYLLTSR
jgi:Protein of unknown function (DUF2752)